MKIKFTHKYKHVLIIKGTQGMAMLSLAVVLSIYKYLKSSVPCARLLSSFDAYIVDINEPSADSASCARALSRLWARLNSVRHRASSASCARVLSLLGVLLIAGVSFASMLQLTTDKAHAATSNTLNFQGRLLTASGARVPDGTYNVQFNLYYVSSGGSSQWTETRTNSGGSPVTVQDGYYSVYLGDVTAFSSSIDWSQDLYLGMTIRGTGSCVFGSCTPTDSEMTPRFKLTAVPYAFRASNVASSDTTTASTDSDDVTIQTGDASGATSNSGDITIDTGTATGTAGALLFGTSNASALTIGRSGVTTTIQGSVSLNGSGTALSVTNDATIGGTLGVTGLITASGGLTVTNGDTFTNAGATLNTATAISNLASGGNIGSAATTVDVATTFNVNQTTASQTLTLPSPTTTTSGRIVYVNNVGSASFTMYGSVIGVNQSNAFIWNGSTWVTTVSLSGSVVSTVGTLDSQTKSADGAVISSNAIYLQTADATYAGLVSTGSQTFAGAKTFGSDLTVDGNTVIGSASSDTLTVNATATFNAPITLAANQSLTLTGGNTASRPASPAEGMLYYDTTTKQLLTYANGKWQGDRAGASRIVAANDSSQFAKDSADYVADGENSAGAGTGTIDGDQVQINNALTAVSSAGGGTVYLMEGTYTIDASISIPNGVTLAGSGASTLIQLGNFGGTSTTIDAITNSDTSTGTRIVIRDLRIDGRDSINTAGSQTAIYLNGMGGGTGASARPGAKITNTIITNFRNDGISLSASSNGTFSGNTIEGNDYGVRTATGASYNTFTGNISQGNTNGFQANSAYNTFTGNTSQGNSNTGILLNTSAASTTITGNTFQGNAYGIYDNDADYVTITGNNVVGNSSNGIVISSTNNSTISGNAIYSTSAAAGLYVNSSDYNNITGNNIFDSGGATTNSGIHILNDSDYNNVTGNYIADSSCTTSCYAIYIASSTVDGTYLADNRYLTTAGTNQAYINDAGTNTRYASQAGAASTLQSDSSIVKALATSVLSGSINPTASASVTGVSTKFTTELVVGDRITVSGETRTVTVITSDTALTVDTAFSDNANDTSVDRLPAAFLVRDSAGVNTVMVNDLGATTFRNSTNSTTAFLVQNASGTNIVAVDSSTPGVTVTGTLAVSGDATFTSDIAVNGDDITSDGNLTLNATGYVRVGDSGTPTTASGDDDLYVEGDLEADGTLDVLGVATLRSTLAVQGASVTVGTSSSTNGVVTLLNSTNAFGVSISASAQTVGSATISIPNTSGVADTFCLYTLNNCGTGYLSSTLADNTADVWDVQEGTNNYININTTNSSENISFGNATTNPSYNFLGSGTLAVAGAQTVGGNLTVDTNTLYVDATNNRVGVGTTAPQSAFEAVGDIVSKGTSWTSRTASRSAAWNSMTYGNGMFVAVASTGTGNRVMTSPDGINWTTRTSAGDYIWEAVTYGNGMFVAVGSSSGTSNQVMTSPDGINWTMRTSAANNSWTEVAYGNGLFVATSQSGTNNRVMTSPDGVNWTSRTSAADNTWSGLTYGNGMFVAVAQTGSANRVMTSTDGITWNTQTSVDNTWTDVTYGNGIFVAVATNGTGVMTSSNGTSWTARNAATANSWQDVTFGNGLFVAVSLSGSGDRVMTSVDGINWASRTSVADENWISVAYGNGVFAAVAQNTTTAMSSGKPETIPFSANNTYQGGVTVYGSSTFRSDANSSTAFQFQNASGTNVLAINTSTAGATITGTLSVSGLTTITTLGSADTNTFVCRNSSSQLATCSSTPLTSSLTDNITDAFDLQEGTNNYININTTNSSEAISLGNTTTNPDFNLLGSGTTNISGAVNITSGTLYVEQTASSYIQTFDYAGGGGNDIALQVRSDSAYAIELLNAVGNRVFAAGQGYVDVGGSSVAGNLSIFDGSSNYTTITSAAQTGDYTLTIPSLTGSASFCLSTNNCGYVSASLTDNTTDAFDLQEGTNNYININTTNSSENISFGNATTNPSYSFLGTGTVTLAGDLAVNGDDITSDGNLTVNATGYVRIGDTGTPGVASGDDDLYVEGDLEVDANTDLAGTLTVGGTTTLGDAVTDGLTVTAAIQGTSALIFDGSSDDTNETTFSITNPTGDNTQTIQDNSGVIPLGTAGNTLFFTTSGATNVTLPTSGTLTTNPASGSYLMQVPTSTAANTITPTTNSVVGLTVNGTSGTAATAVSIVQGGAATALQVNGTSTGSVLDIQDGGTSVLTVADGGVTTITANGGTGVALTVNNGTSTGNILNIADGGTNIATFADGGAVLFKNTTNSTAAFQVQPSGSTTPSFVVDSTNNRVGIGTSAPTSTLMVAGNQSTTAFSTSGMALRVSGATYTDTGTAASGTVAFAAGTSYGIPTFAASNTGVTYTNSATLYISDAPTAGTNVTLTNRYALYVASGNSIFGGDITTSTNLAVNGNTTIGNAIGDNLTVTAGIQGTSALSFEGSTDDGTNITTFSVTNPTAARTQTIQDNSGVLPLGTAGNTLFFTTSGATSLTLPTSGTVTTNPASGSYLMQVPTTTAANTITPATTGVVGLTVNGTNTGTAATALAVAQTGAATAVTISQSAVANGLEITSTNASQVSSTALSVTQSGTSTGFTGNFVNFTGSSTTGSGNLLNLTSVNTTAGNALNVTANSITTGNAINVNSTGTGLTSGSLLYLTSATTGAIATNGIVSLNASGNYTSTSNVGLLNVSANSTTAGTIASFNGNALTTGVGVRIASTGTGLTSGSLLQVSTATTGAIATNGAIQLTASGNYTSTSNVGLLSVQANSTAAGTIQNINGNALTTGQALYVGSTGTGLTSGSLLYLTSATTGAIATNGIVSLNASGNYTSTSNVGLLNVSANSTTAGTVANISGTAVTTGTVLQVTGSTATTNGLTLNVTSGRVQFTPTNTIASAAGATWNGINVPATTATLSGSTSVTTATGFNLLSLAAPTITSGSALTVTNAATSYIGGAPIQAGSTTITNAYSLWVDSGRTRLDGDLVVDTDTLYVDSTSDYVSIGGTTDAGAKLNIFTSNSGYEEGLRQTDGTISLVTAVGFSQAYLGTESNHGLVLFANSIDSFGVTNANVAFVGSSVAGASVATGAGDLYVTDAVEVDGAALFQNSTDSTTAFQILESSGAGGSSLLTADTTNFLLKVAPTQFTSSGSTQSFATSGSVTGVDSYSTIAVNATVAGVTVTVPSPVAGGQVVGRVLYVAAVNNSEDFALSLSGTSVEINMKENSTATLIWNGTGWTAAGASSSTDLQAAYDNTAATAGGAEIVLASSGTGGLTIRNDATTAITGGLLEVQTAIGSNLFTVNNNATEYAANGGAESSTFTAWAAAPAGGTVTRYTTVGDNIATGAGSVYVNTTSTANTGAKNTLTASLTANLRYKVSYTARHTSSTSTFTTLETYFSNDGTTAHVECGSDATIYYNKWTRVDCTFTPTSVGASNAIIFRHSDAVEHDFYIDNFSVTVDASSNHAVDGDVDSALGTNWQAYDADGGAGTTTPTRDTSNIYNTSGAVAVATTGPAANLGVRNNMAITPTVSTQYLVTFYAKLSSGSFTDITVGFLPAGGSSTPNANQLCTDYNTQTLSTSSWTKITCLVTTPSSGISDPDLVIYQPTSGARTFYIDALKITLNTNNSSNVQVGGGQKGGPTTLFTLDRSYGAPIADNNDAYLGSMYYDTSTGRIQCYEADGWGACGAAPDNIVNLNPEYAGAVLNGSGVGTMTADFCSNDAQLSVNSSLCSSGEAKNYYRWTSPQATQQTYSIYVTYQLPATFNGFSSDDTVQLVARTDSTSNAAVTYEMYKSTGSDVTQCGTGETTVVTSANTWQSVGINGNESTGCSFSSSSASNFIIFKLNLKANSNANAYVSTLSFTTTGR